MPPRTAAPPGPSRAPAAPPAADALRDAALAYQDFHQQGGPADPERLDSWCESYRGGGDAHARLFRDVARSDPGEALRVASGVAGMPSAGDDFLGFRLVTELGRGAFGRVFLAQQGDLADRPVALKVSTEVHAESQRLARLQHTNIVPVYSFHRRGPLQAVCMPYFGSATLADVLTDLVQREGLPGSGKGLTSTLYDRQSRTLRNVESQTASAASRRKPASGPRAAVAAADKPVLPPPPGGATQALQRLEGLSYVDAVLWIAARVADGLAHAHERGILHRDLKPANVLLTDDGQPMLLDFNLSEDSDPAPGAAAALIGGTLPYMAPEHLDAFRGNPRDVDARSDLYSLGVVLFELLTGRHPFQRHVGGVEEVLPAMIAERLGPPPSLRAWNPRVSPAAEAVVRKCLAPHQGQRYQSARDLREDLERQLENRPLRHAPDRSLRERATKFARRNPWVTSSAAALGACVFAAVLLAGLALGYKRRLERGEAVATLAGFRDEARAARQLIDARGIDPAQGDEGRRLADKALARYGVLDPEPWQARPAFARLPADEQRKLSAEVGDLLLLAAGALPPAGGAAGAKAADAGAARAALGLNRAAEACFPAGQAPRALWAQRAELHGLLGEASEARRLRLEARATPVRDGWDHYLVAREEARRGRMPEAVKELREAIRLDPANFSAWFLMGNCHLWGSADDFARESDAVGDYTTCLALRPDYYAPYYNRGLAYQRLGRPREAEADFTHALEARPGLADAFVQRAIAREAQKKLPGALEDLAKAEELGAPPTRVLFLRATVLEQQGDRAGARRARAEGLRHTPEDDAGWIARGLARAADDPRGALKDFEEAARLNPRSRHALQNQAAVLAERLERPREAVRRLDELAKLYPDLVPTYSARAVLYARLGERGPAHADARRALTRDAASGEVLYQVANAYALTSRQEPEDRAEALRLLARALERGFGFDVLASDRDMDPLRDDPRFADLARLVKATKALQTAAAR